MDMIIKLICQMKDELEDAEKYIECANSTKEADKELADVYHTLAGEEIGHMERLQGQASRLIREESEEGEDGSMPLRIKYIWEYERDNIEAKAHRIKALISLYKK